MSSNILSEEEGQNDDSEFSSKKTMELIDAKNDLKEVIKNLSLAELEKLATTSNDDFIYKSKGDVDVYASSLMTENAGYSISKRTQDTVARLIAVKEELFKLIQNKK